MPRSLKKPRVGNEPDSPALAAYKDKRDFTRTTEPGPERRAGAGGPLTFVIQKHDARRLHYDFRLEVDGVLKSWSVPKGPSLDTQDKRLAVMVEDHPLDYGSFEGIIPKGQYGAGEVIVWDNGTYSPDEGGLTFEDRDEAEERMRRGIVAGKISITMRGRKMKGSWTLVKIARAENEWLLIKHQDAWVDAERDITEDDRSVICDLAIEDLQAGRLPDRARAAPVLLNPADAPGARRARLAASLTPMLATLADKPFSNPDWLFEPKLDGVRAIALVHDGAVKLISRRGLDATKQYPLLAGELSRQPASELALDGEIVALDDDGRPSFELIQPRLNLTRDSDIKQAETAIPVYYYVFDLLHLDGYDLRRVPLEQRKTFLERAVAPTDRIRLLDHFEEAGELAYKAAMEHGLEGVVAKRRDSLYESGARSKSWLKIKSTQTDEFVIGGYSQGEGARRATFGSLLLGQYSDDGLVYAGNVGSGFDDRTLDDLRQRLDAIKAKDNPFSTQPPLKGPTTWVRPELVVEVKFAQRTREGYLRAPVFLHLRDDKPAAEVRRGDVVHVTSSEAQTERSLASPVESSDAGDVLDQLQNTKDRFILNVQDYKISLTNMDKPLWPKLGRRPALTKRDLIVYFAQVSPYLLPHLRDRPITLTRYPNGISGQHFFQKHWDAPLPEFVDTFRLWSSHNEGDQEYLLCNNLPTLLWLGQIADLEVHTWYSRVNPEPDGHHLSRTYTGSDENIEGSLLNYPDFIVFDLDPYIYAGNEAKGDEPALNRKAFAKTCEVAQWVKEELDSLSLSSFIKTSGKTGLHIYVPILRNLDYSAVRAACETIGQFVLRKHARDVTMEWTVDKRAGKVFFDHNQNVRGKTLASIYSPRPAPEASVSMPLRWDELEDIYPTDFTIVTAQKRLAEVGDLWAGILDAKHDLRGLLQLDASETESKSTHRRKR